MNGFIDYSNFSTGYIYVIKMIQLYMYLNIRRVVVRVYINNNEHVCQHQETNVFQYNAL